MVAVTLTMEKPLIEEGTTSYTHIVCVCVRERERERETQLDRVVDMSQLIRHTNPHTCDAHQHGMPADLQCKPSAGGSLNVPPGA